MPAIIVDRGHFNILLEVNWIKKIGAKLDFNLQNKVLNLFQYKFFNLFNYIDQINQYKNLSDFLKV